MNSWSRDRNCCFRRDYEGSCRARHPLGILSVTHVFGGKEGESQWISTTSNPTVATRYDKEHKNGIVIIDRSKIEYKVVYAPYEIPSNIYDEMALEMAERDSEYLVYMHVPQSAIVGYYK